MKIAIDVSQMCYEGTGVARYVYGLTKSLLSLGTPHEFVLYAGTLRQRTYFTHLKQEAPWNKAIWKIFPLPPKLAGYALSDTSIPFELLTGPVDVIHASDWSQPSSKAKIVTTVHDLVFIKYPETVDPLILSTQKKRLKKIVESETVIIADSVSTKNDLVEIYQLNPDRVNIVYPSYSSIYSPQSKSEIDRVKNKYSLPGKYIFSLGTQEPRKNLARLAQAVQGLDLPLVLAGKHGWGEETKTIGYVPDTDLPALYSGAEVFAFPSLYEGFGFPVLEAMACGTPVVTSNISSLPELAGDAAVLVDPKDIASIAGGIRRAIAERTQLVKLGLMQCQKFSWEKTAKQVMEVYEKTQNRD